MTKKLIQTLKVYKIGQQQKKKKKRERKRPTKGLYSVLFFFGE